VRAAFYSVSDSRFFLGAVGLVNSLRLLGHTEPIFVCDCGLSPEQRELLAPQVTFVDGPADTPGNLLKTIAPLEHPADAMVVIDADMIVTRPLSELIDRAAAGNVIAPATGMDRFVPEWGELLDLGPVRRTSYLSSGVFLLGGAAGEEVLRLIHERVGKVEWELTYWRRNVREYPLLHADQDLFNAVLATCVEEDRIVPIEGRLAIAPPFAGLELVDERSLRCEFADGVEPYLVHHWKTKPWLEPTHHGVYSRLLRRLMVGSDVAVTVPDHMIPLRMRTGLLAYAERKRVNVRERLRWHVREPLSRLRSS
jgi:hypothetical protein